MGTRVGWLGRQREQDPSTRTPGDTPNRTHRTVMLLRCGRMPMLGIGGAKIGVGVGAASCELKAPLVSPGTFRSGDEQKPHNA